MNTINRQKVTKRTTLVLLILVLFSISGMTQKTQTPNQPIQQSADKLLAGEFQAVAYSGFRSGQYPDRGEGAVNPSYEQVKEDLQILSQNSIFSLIRLYDCGKNSELVLQIIKENNINIKVMLGAWLEAEVSNHEGCAWLNDPIPRKKLQGNKRKNFEELKRAIRLANQYPEIVVAVNVGNESLVDWTDHLIPVETVISYVKSVKAGIKQPVTVADNFLWWADSGAELAKVVDFLAIHTYPLWGGKDIDEGLNVTIDDIRKVRLAFPDKMIVVSEAGWATVASEFGERASEEKQLRYFNELMALAKEMNITTFFFEAFDEDWKGDPKNAMGAEKHWGLYNVDRTPKMAMKQLKKNNN
ncbi:MAG: hypothetical protein K9H64_00470 [Bacteroidales bacterium]|nr:hypothetical protein [Bacteroidales bacterium]MCF8454368.1 hypothetical protein [Bacteroidales bacterium]